MRERFTVYRLRFTVRLQLSVYGEGLMVNAWKTVDCKLKTGAVYA